MVAVNGYIPIKGKIKGHDFTQTLVPVRGQPYRLYVNGPMLKGANTKVGQVVSFEIGQNKHKRKAIPMNRRLKEKLVETRLEDRFRKLAASRQKEIKKYLNNLKNEESLTRNIEKVIMGLKGVEASSLFRLP
jgi:hypothetical protein